jgi:hypothetical protein
MCCAGAHVGALGLVRSALRVAASDASETPVGSFLVDLASPHL